MEEEIQHHFEHLSEMPLIRGALRTLETQLSPDLSYHSAEHSQDVLREVLRFAVHDGISGRDLELLAIGAAFHDIGFIWKQVDNEWLGASRAREAMELSSSYSESEIQRVQDMILDTQLVNTSMVAVQIPSTELGRYLLDADLGNLGRPDFFEKSELLRKELGIARPLFYRDAVKFLEAHEWLTPAAQALRGAGQAENLTKLRDYEKTLREGPPERDLGGLDLSHLLFLSRLPLLLNSSLHTDRLVETAIEHLRGVINAEAATVFLLDESRSQLRFWALQGGEAHLQDKRLPADRGIVGWVIQNEQSVLTNDPKSDPRFYSGFDEESSSFVTKSILCVPLLVRSKKIIGALQILNSTESDGFQEGDQLLAERFGHQLALAIDNATLFEKSEKMRNNLAQLDKRKGEMITVLTHELRTPLNVILGAADLLGNPDVKDSAIREKMSATLQRGVQRLVKLSQQLQSLSRVEGDTVHLQRKTFPVEQLLTSVTERFENPMRVRNLTFTVNTPKSPISIQGDEALLFLVLTNLLSNAVRFTKDGGEITLTVKQEHGLVHFSVEDTGIGIPREELENIFEKFYEVGDALVHSSGEYDFGSGGLGLGLSAVRSVVQAHGSDVVVTSEEGKGSCFSFQIPETATGG
ncbi:ATP-binding protein [bacterium]|nr:ATP-binding protein [bacterium]